MSTKAPPVRADFVCFRPLPTRWHDNDVYHHVNNTVYYSFFDTAINGHMIDTGVLDFERGGEIGLVVETGCRFHAPLAFPMVIDAGLRVAKLGTSSVRWEVGLFAPGAERAAADGFFVHVFVDRTTRRPVPIAGRLREVLGALLISPPV
jgi:acyl-CoA thioester hydrolase